MYSSILSKIRTSAEADELLMAVRELKNQRFSLSKASQQAPANLRQSLETVEDKVSWLDGLEEQLQQLPELSLTLAIEPDEAFLQRLSTWVKSNLGPEVVLDWSRQRQLLGGAQVAFKGKYGDFSVRHKLTTALKQWQSSTSI